MRIDFMHLNDKLATVLINVSDGSIVEVRDVVDAAKMPVGTVVDGSSKKACFSRGGLAERFLLIARMWISSSIIWGPLTQDSC